MPGHETGNELLTQSLAREAGSPQFHLHAHETRGEVLLIKGACLRPLRRKIAWRRIHLRLPLKQAVVSLVKHSNDELVFASKVVMDQCMVDPGFGCNIAHIQARISIASE